MISRNFQRHLYELSEVGPDRYQKMELEKQKERRSSEFGKRKKKKKKKKLTVTKLHLQLPYLITCPEFVPLWKGLAFDLPVFAFVRGAT